MFPLLRQMVLKYYVVVAVVVVVVIVVAIVVVVISDTIDQETCIGHLCDDSIMLVLAFNELLQTTIPIGHNNESLMKVVN